MMAAQALSAGGREGSKEAVTLRFEIKTTETDGFGNPVKVDAHRIATAINLDEINEELAVAAQRRRSARPQQWQPAGMHARKGADSHEQRDRRGTHVDLPLEDASERESTPPAEPVGQGRALSRRWGHGHTSAEDGARRLQAVANAKVIHQALNTRQRQARQSKREFVNEFFSE